MTRPAESIPSRMQYPSEDPPSWIAALKGMPGVDAAFLAAEEQVLYVVSREHDAVRWEQLLELEAALQSDRDQSFHVTVRAHQGRDPRDMFPGLDQVL